MRLVEFEDGAEDPGQIPDVLGNQKVVLHEALDASAAGVIRVTHSSTDLGLDVEGQPLLGTAGEVMNVATNRPQELLSSIEALQLVRRQHAQLDELTDIVGAIDVFGYPKQRVQVSQPPLPSLMLGSNW